MLATTIANVNRSSKDRTISTSELMPNWDMGLGQHVADRAKETQEAIIGLFKQLKNQWQGK